MPARAGLDVFEPYWEQVRDNMDGCRRDCAKNYGQH